MKNLIAIIVFTFLFSSCKKEEIYNADISRDGRYFIEKLSTDRNIDIDRDGVSHSHLSNEIINLIGFSFLILDTKDFQKRQTVQLILPQQTLDDSYENGFYWSGSDALEGSYTLKGDKLIIDNKDIFYATFMNDTTITVDFQKKFYTSEGEEMLKLNAICVRRHR